jgi:phosphoglycolate phosphatase-like HAD superfamily hydrolase
MTLDIERIRALCFDVDGTLSDTDDLYMHRISSRLPRFLFRAPERTARRMVMWIEAPGNALLGLADSLGLDDEMVAFINWMNRHRTSALAGGAREKQAKDFLLVPGVDEMLRRLKGRYPMAVVSVRDERGTMAFLEEFDLVQYFDAIVTGFSARRTKPYPDPILLAAQKMDVPPEDCLMIGDTTVDIRAGKAARAQTVGVLCGFGEEVELRRMGADLILEATPNLAGVLLK